MARSSQLAEISAKADYDVDNLFNSTEKKRNREGERDVRTERLREKLDILLEERLKDMFWSGDQVDGPGDEAIGSKGDKEIGIRLFKETPVFSKEMVPKKRRKKKHRVKISNENGIIKLNGLAVVDTYQILADAEKIRRKGRKEFND